MTPVTSRGLLLGSWLITLKATVCFFRNTLLSCHRVLCWLHLACPQPQTGLGFFLFWLVWQCSTYLPFPMWLPLWVLEAMCLLILHFWFNSLYWFPLYKDYVQLAPPALRIFFLGFWRTWAIYSRTSCFSWPYYMSLNAQCSLICPETSSSILHLSTHLYFFAWCVFVSVLYSWFSFRSYHLSACLRWSELLRIP